jgi:hypothetical protein
MATDKTGKELVVGDDVVIFGKVIAVDHGLYNVVVQTNERTTPELDDAGEENVNSHFTSINLSGLQVEKVS